MSPAEEVLLRRVLEQEGSTPDRLLPILLGLQRHYHYLPRHMLEALSRQTQIPAATIEGVVSFYHGFRLVPQGRHLVKVCDGTACHVKGSTQVFEAIRHTLGLQGEGDTDAAGEFTVRKVFCLGCCTLAPAVQIDQVTYGHLTPDTVDRMLEDFRRTSAGEAGVEGVVRGEPQGEVRLCMDSCCVARGCGKTHAALRQAIRETGVSVRVKPVSCVVMCERAPLVEVAPAGVEPVRYSGLSEDQLRPMLLRHFRPRSLLARARNAVSGALEAVFEPVQPLPVERHEGVVREEAVKAYFGPQQHVATEGFGETDPLSLEEYEARGGFAAWRRCGEDLTPAAMLALVRDSGLRGRGGAGFPSHRKWELVAAQTQTPKYVVANGDEGDPGAFMDRMLLESFPYRVIEGLLLAAWAVGARRGCLYVRAEYPFAVGRLREALARVKAAGLLERGGESFEVEVFEGAGAFVCGEETALLESLEGRRGIPRLRPPFPAERGLFEQPTLVANVETLSVVPWIARHGAGAFAEVGTASSAGTKVFALAGKVRHGGLIEVPMGITIRQIVDEIGGGVPNGRGLKAVLIGGPSGGCVPATLVDTPIDYESLEHAGAIMGSGGLVVLDDEDCMVAIARYFLRFCQEESCGKCTFCRVGTRKLLDIFDRLVAGKGAPGDLEELETLSAQVKAGSLCGLGRTAPNPVVSSLRHFRAEYEAHLRGVCPAGKCQALIRYEVNDRCVGCTLCAQQCADGAIELTPYQKHRIDDALCTRCGICRQVCPEEAIDVRSP